MLESKGSKGFTLIELLAVIVVLAIIALISIPIITNVIEKAKKGAVKSSAYGLVEAGELYLANNLSKGLSEDIEFTCSGSKCIKDDKEIAYKGDIDSGTLKLYTDGKITLCIEKDNYGAYKLATEKEVTVEKGTCNDDYTVDAYISKKEYDNLKNELDDLRTQINNYHQTKTGTITTTNDGKIEIPVDFEPSLIFFWGTNSQNYKMSLVYSLNSHNLGVMLGSGGTAYFTIGNITYSNSKLNFTITGLYGTSSSMYAGTYTYMLIK